MGRTEPVRIDVLLAQNSLAESREEAEKLIMAGLVLVNDRLVDKPGAKVASHARIRIKDRPLFVSRGGIKLDAALGGFDLDVNGLVAADIGASTGGFTDCLLQRGAAKVYAIDVGHGQLAWRLRRDPRVVVMERTNVRLLESLPEQVGLVTVDTSFISLRLVLPVAQRFIGADSRIVALVKPQFEARREHVGKGGVVRSPATHRAVLEGICRWVAVNGLHVDGLVPSPLRGPSGNVEFFMLLTEQGTSQKMVRGERSNLDFHHHLQTQEMVEACLSEVREAAE